MVKRDVVPVGDQGIMIPQDPLTLISFLINNKDNTPVLTKFLQGVTARSKVSQDIKTLKKYIEKLEKVDEILKEAIDIEKHRREFLRIAAEDELESLQIVLKTERVKRQIIEEHLETHKLLYPEEEGKSKDQDEDENPHQVAKDEIKRLGDLDRVEMREKYKNAKLFDSIVTKIRKKYQGEEAEDKINQLRNLFMEKKMI